MSSNPAYTRTLSDKPLRELLEMADLTRALVETPAWQYVLARIDEHAQASLQRLLHEGTKPEDIPRLRGLVSGLASAREAAESVITFAEEAERKANQRVRAQEQNA